MLEAGRVGRVTGNGNVYVLLPQDGYTFAHIVGAIALHLGTGTVRVGNLLHHVHLTRIVVELSLYVGEAVDATDDHGSILAQTVQNDAERLLAHLVCHLSNLDGSLGSRERLVTGKEGKALCLLTKQTGCQVSVSDTYLAVVGNRTGDAEALQTDTDSLGSLGSILHALLDSDGCTADVCPLGILETDALSVFTHLVGVDTCIFANLVCLLDAVDTILLQSSKHLVDAALLTFKTYFSYHILIPPYSLRGSIALTTPCSAVVRPYEPVNFFTASLASMPFLMASIILPRCTYS